MPRSTNIAAQLTKTADRPLLSNRPWCDGHPLSVDQPVRHTTQIIHIHVLVVEDNFDLVGTVIDYLEAAGVVCDHARDGQAGLNLTRANRYDVILLNITLPCINSRQAYRQLREAGLQTPALMLTVLDTLQSKLDGFDVGVDNRLLKPFGLPELLIRLQALSRHCSDQAQRLQADDLMMDLDSRRASHGGTPLALSPTAWEILECLMHVSSAPVTREQLGHSVRGDEPPENNTLNVHMHHPYSAVGKGFTTPPTHTLHSVGFQLERK